jgi:hypothetical protein
MSPREHRRSGRRWLDMRVPLWTRMRMRINQVVPAFALETHSRSGSKLKACFFSPRCIFNTPARERELLANRSSSSRSEGASIDSDERRMFANRRTRAAQMFPTESLPTWKPPAQNSSQDRSTSSKWPVTTNDICDSSHTNHRMNPKDMRLEMAHRACLSFQCARKFKLLLRSYAKSMLITNR